MNTKKMDDVKIATCPKCKKIVLAGRADCMQGFVSHMKKGCDVTTITYDQYQEQIKDGMCFLDCEKEINHS